MIANLQKSNNKRHYKELYLPLHPVLQYLFRMLLLKTLK